jgi:hypothetical protein
MSKKLLSEAQVRRFQTLATIRPIHEMESRAPVVEEVETEEEMEMVAGEEEVELDAADAVEMDTAEAPEEVEEADIELDQDLVNKFAEAAATIGEVAGILNAGSDDELDGGELAPVEAEEEMEAAPEAEEMEMDADEEELELQEALSGISYIPSQEEIVKVVAKRVAKRLQEAKAAQRQLNKALGKK